MNRDKFILRRTRNIFLDLPSFWKAEEKSGVYYIPEVDKTLLYSLMNTYNIYSVLLIDREEARLDKGILSRFIKSQKIILDPPVIGKTIECRS